jgi:hypothetical protein
MEPSMTAGDEQYKQQLAEELSVVNDIFSVKSAGQCWCAPSHM